MPECNKPFQGLVNKECFSDSPPSIYCYQLGFITKKEVVKLLYFFVSTDDCLHTFMRLIVLQI